MPRTGAVHGSGNHPPAAVMSTYLSHKPATKIYKSVFEPTPGEEDDFAWLADNMSSAAEYLAWHQQASAVQADLAQARLRFGGHVDQVESASAQYEQLVQQRSEVEAARSRLVSLTEAVTEDLQQKYDDALSIRDSAKSTLENNTANLDALMRENGQKLQQLQLWEAKLASAEVDLADAEDREGQHIPPLNVRDLVEELTGLDSALDAASGASREVQKFIEAWDADGTPNLSSPTLHSLLES